jgi:hypothetical protein
LAVAREATRGVEFLSQYPKVVVVTVAEREKAQRSPMTAGVGNGWPIPATSAITR